MKVHAHLSLSVEAFTKLKETAESEDTTMSGLVEDLIERYIKAKAEEDR